MAIDGDRWGQTRLIDPSRSMDHRSIESDPIDPLLFSSATASYGLNIRQ